ncbi:MAG: hypothetical protein WC850_01975 [Candidatus Gracilibacteria bacterium]
MTNTYSRAKYYLAGAILIFLLGIARLLAVDSLSLSTTDIDDTIVSGTPVATITGNNASGAIFYSMPCTTPGVDDAKFSIGGAGSDELIINEDPDYVTQSSYNICIRAVDDNGIYEQNFILNVLDKTVPEFNSITVSSSNSNSLYAKEGDNITFSVNLLNLDSSGIGNSLTFDLGTSTGNILNLDSNTGALSSHTKTYTVSAGQSGTLDIQGLVFTDNATNALSGFTLPYSLTSNIIVDTTAPVITFIDDVSATSNLTDDINITATDDYLDTTSLYYGFSADSTCDGTDTYDQVFTSGNTFTINDTLNNGKYICVKAVDYAGNVTYLSSTNALNIATVGIDLSGTGMNENVGVGFSVGDFSTVHSTGTTFTYDFAVGTGSADNGSFTISGTTLVAQFDPNYEIKNSYNIRISSIDENSTVVENEFTIYINDVNEQPTDITLSGTTLEENVGIGAVVGDLITTDEDIGATHSYTFVGGTGSDDNTSFSISGSSLVTVFDPDYEVKSSYTILLRSTDNGGLTTDKQFTITVNNIAEAPTDILLSGSNVNENVATGTLVGNLSSVDQDVGDTHTYTLVAGTGSDDNASFSITGTGLFVDGIINFEAKTTYSILVRSTDSLGMFFDKQFNITVNNLNEAPIDLTLSGSTIDENVGVGVVVGDLTTTDEDVGDTFAYSFVGGTGSDDNSIFSLSGTSIVADFNPDYEANSSYTIRVQTQDSGGLNLQKIIIITVNNINETPTDISISANNIDENLGVGTAVGDFDTIDQDIGDTYTYTFVAGTGSDDNSSFSISGSTLVAEFNGDFEIKPLYSILVRSTDAGGLSTDKQFNININDINLAPSDLTLSGSTIDENLSVGTTIGDLTGTDDGENNGGLTYNFACSTGGVDDSSFTITGTTLSNNSIFNYESKNTYNICVRVSDGTLSFDKNFAVTINDVNETPTDIAITGTTIDENLGAGAVVGTLSTTDQDVGDTHTYTLVTGTGDDDNGSFSISGSILVSDFDGNYEVKNNYTVRLRSTDALGLTTEKQFTITINDLNLAPTDLTLSGSTIDENLSIGTTIGDLTGTDDGENNGTLTYSLTCTTPGVDDSSFTLSGTTLSSNGVYNYEAKNSYSICARVSDGTYFFDKNFIITINDINETPTDIAITGSAIDENLGTGTIVGTLAAVDPDTTDTHTYILVVGTGSDDNSSFSISGSTLVAEFSADYEVKNSYTILVRSTDIGGLTTDKQFTITINDINLAPSDLTLSGSIVLENTFVGTLVGNLLGTDDGEDNGTLTYTLACSTGGVDDSKFNIVGDELRTATPINFESGSALNICVKVSDGVLSLDKDFIIDISNVNESPYNFIFTQNLFNENTATGFVVGDLSSLDEDLGDLHIYDFGTGIGSTDNLSFTLSGSQVLASFSPNYELQNLYQVKFKVTDSGGISTDLQSTISVTDVNETPTDITLGSNSVDENVGTGAFVGLFDTTDVDLGDFHTYTLVGGLGSADNGSFTIIGDALITDFVGDYETKDTYFVRVRSIDSGGLTIEKQFTININNVDESGVIVTLSGSTLAENMGTGTTLGDLNTISSLSGATSFTYTLVAGTGSDDNSSFSISGNSLVAEFDANYEVKNTYSILVRSTDNLSNITDKQFTINILNVNEAPLDIGLSSSTIDENTMGVNIVGAFTTSDTDLTDTYTYNLVGGIGSNDNASFTIVGNTLLSGFTPDYETKNLYYIRVRSTDSGGLTTEKQFTITINDLPENPSDITFSGSLALDENTASGVTLGSFGTTGTNSGATYTYTLSGTGGDNASFTISGDNLITNFIPNYEVQNTYTILVRSTDSLGYFFEESFVITINNVNENPTDINLSSSNVAENAAIGTIVGALSTTDEDLTDTYTYTFVSGTGSDDNSSFAIIGNTIITSFTANYETKNSYTILVRSTDALGLFTDKQLTINITDLNQAPTDITLSGSVIDENSPIGTTIGTVSGVDDGEDNGTLTYSLSCVTPGVDDSSFTLSGTVLSNNGVFNYEAKNTYNICVRVSDGVLGFDKNFVILVNDLVELPTDITFSGSLALNENTASGTTLGDFDSVGVNTGVTYTYTLVAGTGSDDNASFTISGNSLVTDFVPDYETKNTYNIRIRTTDNLGASYEEAFTITIIDVNQAPTDITLSGSIIDENLATGTFIGDFTGTDDGEDTGTMTYAFNCSTGGIDDSSFTISGATLLSNAVFNYDVKNTYNICVSLSDGVLSFDKDFVITVNGLNETPTDITLSANNIDENLGTGATVGTLSTVDTDLGDTHTYTLVAGTGSDDNGSFSITGSTLIAEFDANYEIKNSYTILVRSTDIGGFFTEKQFTINVTDLNNAPTNITLSGSNIDENLPLGTFIGDFTGTDDGEDTNTMTYSFTCTTPGVDDNNFTISGSTLSSNRIFDYETQNIHNICVRISDGVLSFDKDFTITINDISENPTNITFSGSLAINENTASGITLGDFDTVGTNSGVTYTYTLVAGTGSADNASFTISGNSLVTDFIPDYETQNAYGIRVQSVDSLGAMIEKQFVITINDINQAPTDITLSSNNLNENLPIGTTIGNLTGTDDGEDTNTMTYSFTCTTPGIDDASFTLSGTVLSNNSAFDYETKNTYNICVRVSDGILNFDKNFVIIVNDVAETGTDITFSGSLAFNENSVSGLTLGDFNTVGTNTGVTYTYTFIAGTGSNDNGVFTISGSTLTTNFIADYETKNTYSIRVESLDSLGFSIEKQFSIIINDVYEGSSGGGSTGGGSGGGGSYGAGSVKDSCPDGDYSTSYYDRTCGTKPKTGTGTTTGTGITSTGSTSTGTTTSTGTSITDKIDQIIDKTFEDVNYVDDKGDKYTIQKTITGKYIIKKPDGTYDDKVLPTIDKAKEYIDGLTKVDVVVLGNYDFDESITPVIYVSRYGDRFISRKLTDGRYILYTEKGMKLNGFFNKQYEVLQYLQRVFGKHAFAKAKHTS